MSTRREFLSTSTAVAMALMASEANSAMTDPWHRRTTQWGQTNVTEKDPARYDIPWWREFWKRTLKENGPAAALLLGMHLLPPAEKGPILCFEGISRNPPLAFEVSL